MTTTKAVKKKVAPKPAQEPDLATRLAALEEQVTFLSKSRPGRKYLPIQVSKEHVCGVDPERDSETCTDASLWRRNKGCMGDACVTKSTDYYRTYRKSKAKAADE